MSFVKFFLLTIYIFFGSLIIQVQELKAQEGLLKTESIRQKLFSRMDNRKKSAPLRTGIENILIGIFSRVTDSESVWIRIENRSEFRKWTFKQVFPIKKSPTFANQQPKGMREPFLWVL